MAKQIKVLKKEEIPSGTYDNVVIEPVFEGDSLAKVELTIGGQLFVLDKQSTYADKLRVTSQAPELIKEWWRAWRKTEEGEIETYECSSKEAAEALNKTTAGVYQITHLKTLRKPTGEEVTIEVSDDTDDDILF